MIENLDAQFKVTVTYKGAQWSVWRRYSQFDNLRAALVKLGEFKTLPALPDKRYLRSSLQRDFLKRRLNGLSKFLQELIASPGAAAILETAEMSRFLHVPYLLQTNPQCVPTCT